MRSPMTCVATMARTRPASSEKMAATTAANRPSYSPSGTSTTPCGEGSVGCALWCGLETMPLVSRGLAGVGRGAVDGVAATVCGGGR